MLMCKMSWFQKVGKGLISMCGFHMKLNQKVGWYSFKNIWFSFAGCHDEWMIKVLTIKLLVIFFYFKYFWGVFFKSLFIHLPYLNLHVLPIKEIKVFLKWYHHTFCLNFPYHTSCIKFYQLILLFPQESVKHGGFVKDTLENQENLTPQGICFSSLTSFNICLFPSLFFMITVDYS